MLKNITFVLIAAFWVVMNVLLWRLEIGSGSDLVSSVPVRTVFEKILAAPDSSTLGIIVDGQKIGYIRWRPIVQEVGATDKITTGAEPEGMVESISQYTLELDGSFLLRHLERSVRMGAEVSFNRALEWREFVLDGFARPVSWEIKGSAENRDIWLKTTSGDEEWIRRVTFDELHNPGPLLAELNVPIGQLLPGDMAAPQTGSAPSPFEWKAYQDWVRIGSNRLRIYRLEGRFLQSIQIVVLVSRAGEILKVELPGGTKLLNDALFAI